MNAEEMNAATQEIRDWITKEIALCGVDYLIESPEEIEEAVRRGWPHVQEVKLVGSELRVRFEVPMERIEITIVKAADSE